MKIRYITSHGRAERIDFEYSEKDHLILSFDQHCTGAVLLDGKFFPLKDGEARIRLSALKDGEYTPRLESERGIFTAEGFTKRGKGISVADADEPLIRRLVERCYTLDRELEAISKRLGELESICRGHNIFDFERKEHE